MEIPANRRQLNIPALFSLFLDNQRQGSVQSSASPKVVFRIRIHDDHRQTAESCFATSSGDSSAGQPVGTATSELGGRQEKGQRG